MKAGPSSIPSSRPPVEPLRAGTTSPSGLPSWQKLSPSRAEDQRLREEAQAQRDSWIYEDGKQARFMRPEESGNYATSMSNEKYVKYYDPSERDMEYNGAHKQPPHPRQRHRCDYHLEDVIQSVGDGRYPVWDTFTVWWKCMWSPVGQEPARLRKEVWKW